MMNIILSVTAKYIKTTTTLTTRCTVCTLAVHLSCAMRHPPNLHSIQTIREVPSHIFCCGPGIP
eukprot:10487882-Prorocentrum_lima.AAC.1